MNDELKEMIIHVHDELSLLDLLDIDMERLVTLLQGEIEDNLPKIKADLRLGAWYED